MTRYIAFLRAINVGGRNVKMDVLRQVFAGYELENVETYIASGNVVFETSNTDIPALEVEIEAALEEALGFEVAVFIRTAAEVVRAAEDIPFSRERLNDATALNVAFLHEPLDDELSGRLRPLHTDIDDFAVQGREIYWLCREKQSDSKFSNAVLEKALGRPATMRSIKTVQKMAAKFGPSGE